MQPRGLQYYPKQVYLSQVNGFYSQDSLVELFGISRKPPRNKGYQPLGRVYSSPGITVDSSGSFCGLTLWYHIPAELLPQAVLPNFQWWHGRVSHKMATINRFCSLLVHRERFPSPFSPSWECLAIMCLPRMRSMLFCIQSAGWAEARVARTALVNFKGGTW